MMMTEHQCHNLRSHQDKHSKRRSGENNTINEKGKATGSDEISTEMLRALDDENIDVITNLCNIMYNSGVISTDLKQSIFIALPKKSKAQSYRI